MADEQVPHSGESGDALPKNLMPSYENEFLATTQPSCLSSDEQVRALDCYDERGECLAKLKSCGEPGPGQSDARSFGYGVLAGIIATLVTDLVIHR